MEINDTILEEFDIEKLNDLQYDKQASLYL